MENDNGSSLYATLSGNCLNVKDGESFFEIYLNFHNRNIEEGVFLSEEKISKNSFKFTVHGANPDVEYAWYVLRNGERIDVIWYEDTPTLEYTFTQSGIYEIHYFIRDKVDKENKVRYIYESKINL